MRWGSADVTVPMVVVAIFAGQFIVGASVIPRFFLGIVVDGVIIMSHCGCLSF